MVAGGLALWLISLIIELIDLQILLAKVLRQQVQDAVADALQELRLPGRERNSEENDYNPLIRQTVRGCNRSSEA